MRAVVIWIDAFDDPLAERLQLPTWRHLRASSALATVDGRFTQRSGSTPAQLMAGVRSDAGGPASPLTFHPSSYAITRQARVAPLFRDVSSVVVDAPFVDLDPTRSNVRGIVDWGTHDHSGPTSSSPDSLGDEIMARFGGYRAESSRFATPWASPDQCTAMGEALADGVRQRGELTRWLLTERLPDWELAVVALSEAHSAAEGLYHGVDERHPLAHLPSAAAANDAFTLVYRAIDEFVGDLRSTFPDAITVVFTPHGMGINVDDVPSMLLLSELLAVWQGSETPQVRFPTDDEGMPTLEADDDWNSVVGTTFSGRSKYLADVPSWPTRLARRGRSALTQWQWRRRRADLEWMPSMRRQAQWPTMRAFALPTFTIAKVRANIAGREGAGIVDPAEYGMLLDEVEQLVRECRDPVTGRSVVGAVHRPFVDPFAANGSDADLEIEWAGAPLGLQHPRLGTIGPYPTRRTGGHTQPSGVCVVNHPLIAPTDLGRCSEFDVMATVLDLIGADPPWPTSGHPLDVCLGASPPM